MDIAKTTTPNGTKLSTFVGDERVSTDCLAVYLCDEVYSTTKTVGFLGLVEFMAQDTLLRVLTPFSNRIIPAGGDVHMWAQEVVDDYFSHAPEYLEQYAY